MYIICIYVYNMLVVDRTIYVYNVLIYVYNICRTIYVYNMLIHVYNIYRTIYVYNMLDVGRTMIYNVVSCK